MSNLWIAIIIGFLGLDTTIAFQVLISQPIFSCSILGFVLGDFPLGVEIGIMMQLFWLYMIPAGATKFPEGNIASMITCVIAIQFQALEMPNLVFAVSFLFGILFSYLGAQLTVVDRKLNGQIVDWILAAAQTASIRKITFLDMLSIFIYFLLMSMLALIALTFANFLMPFLSDFPAHVDGKFTAVKPIVWGIGIAFTIPVLYQAVKQMKMF